MKFSKIKHSKDHEVGLLRVDEHAHSKDSVETTGINPLPSFVDAVQAFIALFLRVFPALEPERENLRVTTLNLSEKDGDRGLQVSATLTVEHCNNAGVSITTPLITTPLEGADEGRVFLTPVELRLIEHVEVEATRYVGGETAQAEMFASTSANAKAVDERMAEAEVASTRKPKGRGKTKLGGQAAPGELANPGKTVAPTTQKIHDLLAAVGKDVPIDAIERWGSADRDAAQAYAEKAAKGKASSMPLCVQRDSMKPLGNPLHQ